jgi:hypothetical protein
MFTFQRETLTGQELNSLSVDRNILKAKWWATEGIPTHGEALCTVQSCNLKKWGKKKESGRPRCVWGASCLLGRCNVDLSVLLLNLSRRKAGTSNSLSCHSLTPLSANVEVSMHNRKVNYLSIVFVQCPDLWENLHTHTHTHLHLRVLCDMCHYFGDQWS